MWEALTDPERLSEWFANDVELDAAPGGTGVFRWDDGEDAARARRGGRGRASGSASPGPTGDGAESRVTIALEEAEQGTRLRVVETAGRRLAGRVERVGCSRSQALAVVAVR